MTVRIQFKINREPEQHKGVLKVGLHAGNIWLHFGDDLPLIRIPYKYIKLMITTATDK